MKPVLSTKMQAHFDGDGKVILHEPIAIIGTGCRFPGGANNPSAFWELLSKGKDAIVEVPPDRWNKHQYYHPDLSKPGKMYTQHGGFLQEKIDQFDALFFGISPREAACMDPQQRLLLEVVWEALEDAGLSPVQLTGSATGVYIGAFMVDNMLTQMGFLNRNMIGPHTPFSATMTMLSNRISYIFDFQGPSVTIDTACSSSLVAFHSACQALWQGECSLALVGGVNAMLRPETTVGLCKGQFLAPDGHCKSFDERADGYARGEGAGIVVLKRLSAAQRDGDNIYALVRGTGVNQDGRTEGISVPNPKSQESLLRQVCAQAKIKPHQVSYVEAHGTGTSVGDPIEAKALGAVFGENRSEDRACAIGSVKANIGHLEAAAGIAGLIKACLCLKYKQIPPLANLQNPNPAIPFKDLGLRLPTAIEPIPQAESSAFVGINSFGYGGTNACVILESAPYSKQSHGDPETDSSSSYLLPISARSDDAVRELAKHYAQKLRESDACSLQDYCFSASTRRAHHNYRLAITADSAEAMEKELHTFVEHGKSEHVSVGEAIEGAEPVFVYTGMGPQWWGMGQELFEKSAVFRKEVEKCDAIFEALAGWSILKEMLKDESSSKITETQIAQPANFILQVGLTAMWFNMGVQPSAIIGHSVGEVTAAYVAGVLSLEEAMLVSYHRSRLQKKVAGLGGMLAAALSEDDTQEMLNDYDGQVSIAAYNSPRSITLSGTTQPLQEIAQKLEAQGIFNRFLQVEVAYHSHYMDRLEDELKSSLNELKPKEPRIPLYSTVTGRPVETAAYDGAYWCHNIRKPVRFATAIENAITDGHRVFFQIGPHPVLSAPIKECMLQKGTEGAVVPSLRRGQPEQRTLLDALGELYTLGCPLDWSRVYPQGGTYVDIPTYPWQRQSYWNESSESSDQRIAEPSHPLLGTRAKTPTPSWDSDLDIYALRYLNDHQVENLTVYPGAAYVEMALAIHGEIFGDYPCLIESISFSQALILSDGDSNTVRMTYEEKSHEYKIHSKTNKEENDWQLHASGSLSPAKLTKPVSVEHQDIRERCIQLFDAEEHYNWMGKRGFNYGPHFQAVKHIWRRPDLKEIIAEIETDEPLVSADQICRLHPALLDACFQAMMAIQDNNEIYVPARIEQVRFHRKPQGKFWCHGVRTSNVENAIDGNITLFDEVGDVMVELYGIHAPILTNKASRELEKTADYLYNFEWEIAALPSRGGALGGWLLFQDKGGVGRQLARQLSIQSVEPVIEVCVGNHYEQEDTHRFHIPHCDKAALREMFDAVDIGSYQHIVYLWGLDAPIDGNDPTGMRDVVSLLSLVQFLMEELDSEAPHLFIVTAGAQSIGSDRREESVAQAPIVGMLQVALNEYPNSRFSLIDLDPRLDGNSIELLMEELLVSDHEDEIALRGADRFVHRFNKMPADTFNETSNEQRLVRISKDTAYRVEGANSGSIDDIHLCEMRKPELDSGEVELEVHAVTVSHKDLLKAQRMLPEAELEDTYYQNGLGMEVAGSVVAVGEGVSAVAVGDAIVACVPDAFRSSLTLRVNESFYVPKLKGLSFEQCVGLPIAFVTAYYALCHVAGAKIGDRVLIHGAAESVGLAAIQVAQWLGTVVYATCENDQERIYLHSLGVEQVFDIGSIELADEILCNKDYKGIDVVLNMLSMEEASRNFSLLAPFGRFIQIGEHNKAANNQLPICSSNRNCIFSLIDTDLIMVRRPKLYKELLADVWKHFEAGNFAPLPVNTYLVSKLAKAFHAVEESSMIGNTVVSFNVGQNQPPLPMAPEKEVFKKDASYLITGGFGGLGREVAKWMVTQGARNLVLVGRSGAKSEEAQEFVKTLECSGAKVLALAVDIACETDVGRLMEEIGQRVSPLKGVFHAAGVLDDAPLKDLDEDKFCRVMRPKALGAWNLHRCTINARLDYFVLFSSISVQTGNIGQGAYVAANTFLDSLAHYRRSCKLSAISINWGAIGQVGMVAQDKQVEKYLKIMGSNLLSPAQVVYVLGNVLRWNPMQIGIADVDIKRWAEVHSAWAKSSRFSHLIKAAKESSKTLGSSNWAEKITQLQPRERQEQLSSLLATLICETMKLPTEQLDMRQSLIVIGLDSLLATELQAKIEAKFGLRISMLELMKDMSITQLTEDMLGRLEEVASELSSESDASAEKGVEPRSFISTDPKRSDVENQIDRKQAERLLESLDDLDEESVDALLKTLQD